MPCSSSSGTQGVARRSHRGHPPSGGTALTTAATTSTQPQALPRWRELAADGRLRLTTGLVVVEFLAGLQALVVTTTMPRILRDLGGIELYGLVFSGYMLSGLVSIPLVGRQVDRRGPLRPLLSMAAAYSLGGLLCAVAPSMAVLAGARLIQGYGGGALYTLGYGVIGRAYPERVRPRMLALLTGVWVVSGLVGPGYGALLAGTVGWRWAFVLVIPLVAVAVGLLRAPFGAIRGGAEVRQLRLRWPLLLSAGCAAALAGLGSARWWGIAPVAVGVAVMGAALRRILPEGWWRAAPGPPAALATAFWLNVGYFAVDAFLPLLLTGVRSRSVAEAGIAVTLGSMSWFPGSWWQSRVATRLSPRRLTTLGALIMVAGLGVTALALASLPLLLVYAGWTLAGIGMGIAYNTVLLSAMDGGAAATLISGRFIAGRLGIIAGSGVGGASVAVAHTAGASLTTGLVGVVALGLGGTLLGTLTATRLRH